MRLRGFVECFMMVSSLFYRWELERGCANYGGVVTQKPPGTIEFQ